MSELLVPKIYTPEGFTKKNILSGKKAVDVGCGSRKLPGAVGMDVVKDSQADVIHDANVIPWPFQDNEFDLVFMNHSLEHVQDVLRTLSEVHRITKHDGRVIIQVPYFRSTDAYTDPTHIHFFTSQSLDYFLEGAELAEYNYVPFRFRKLAFWYGWPNKSGKTLHRAFKNFIDRHSHAYDQCLSLLLPVACMTWELETVK